MGGNFVSGNKYNGHRIWDSLVSVPTIRFHKIPDFEDMYWSPESVWPMVSIVINPFTVNGTFKFPSWG